MSEYIVKETGFPGTIKQEIVQELVRCKDCLMHDVCRLEQRLGMDGYCSEAERRKG